MGHPVGNLVDAGIGDSDNPTTSVSKSRVGNSQCIRSILNDLDYLLRNVDWKRFASEMVRKLGAALDLPVMRWFRVQDQSVSAGTGSVTGIGAFSEGAFTAINYTQNNVLYCIGYDLHSKSWRSFPTPSYLPPPDAELFKEYSLCGHGGFICAEVSKSPTKGELVVINPLTGESQALPPLLHPRNPVLVHISVDSAKKSYKVVVAGSSSASDEHLSKKVEVFDSSTSKWKEASDLPGPAFGLNENQAAVFLNGNLFLISFLESGGRGVVAFDVENGTWLQDLTTPIPWFAYSNTLQLVESDGKLFLFSEQERDQSVHHCIDELEFRNPKAGVSTHRWRNFVKVKKSGGRGLQVYPEHICVGLGEAKLCIFNTVNRDGVVYNMRDGKKSGGRGLQVNPERTCVGFGVENFNPLMSEKQLYFLLSCIAIAIIPNGACADDQSMDSLTGMWIPSNEFAKKSAVTVLAGLTVIGVAWKFFRWHRAPGDQLDIMQGLLDSPIPRRGDPLFAILPDIPDIR